MPQKGMGVALALDVPGQKKPGLQPLCGGLGQGVCWETIPPSPKGGQWDQTFHLCMFRGQDQGKKRHININKSAGLSRDWAGAKNCVYVFFMCFLFFRIIPYGGEKHINKVPPKIPGQSRENVVYVFYSLCVFCFSLPQGKGQQKHLGCGT